MGTNVILEKKTTEPIVTPFWARLAQWAPKTCIKCGAHWRHLANTIDPSVRDGDAALLICSSVPFNLLSKNVKVAHARLPSVRFRS